MAIVCFPWRRIAMQNVKSKLKDFKPPVFIGIWRRDYPISGENLSPMEFLALLLEDEQSNRGENSYRKRYSKAKLTAQKQIEDFDFSFQPSVDKRIINDCSTCQFITTRRNIVLIGNPGTGKTHLAIGIAIKALLKGYGVLFTQVSQMLHQLNFSRANNSYYQKLDYYLRPDLLILESWALKDYRDTVLIISSRLFTGGMRQVH